MIKNFSIRSKLLLSFFAITVFTIAIGYYSTVGIRNNDKVFDRVIIINDNVKALLEMKNAAYDIDREAISFQNLGPASTQSEAGASANKKFKILAALELLESWQKEYEHTVDLSDPEVVAFTKQIENEKTEIIQTALVYITLKEEGKSKQEVALFEAKLALHIERLKDLIQTAVIKSQQELRIAKKDAERQSILVQRVNGIISLGTVFATLLLAFFITSVIDRPLRKLRDAALIISHGNLTTRVVLDNEDEIGDLAHAINEMTENLEKAQLTLQDRAHETEEKAKELEDQVNETEKTKVAVMNLLEDTRAAEEKEVKRALELKEALQKVNQFASAADQERNMYLLLLASIGEGVMVLDKEKKITIVNRVAERTLGYKSQEITGQRFGDMVKFIHSNKEPLDESFWDQAFASKFSLTPANDLSIIGKDGVLVPIFIIVAPIIDATNQESKGVIITFRDVREERALEEARIGFISTASHQLRTPLTSMRWFSEMLLGGDAGAINEEQKHFVERIYQGTDRMIALVNLLLQMARVEAGRVKIEPIPVDLKATTEGVLMTTKVNFDTKKQKVEIKTKPSTIPTVLMDQDMVWQVIQNLLSNANRYAPVESTIFVEINQTGEEIEYSVRDTGIGIPKNQQARLFEKFFRADNAVSAVPEGSGLGLSLVKILVEEWGGRIWFESEEGKGATFHVTIPLSGMKPKDGDVKLTV